MLPNPTYLPLVTGVVTGGAVLGLLFKAYWLSLALALVTFGLFVVAGSARALRATTGPLPVGLGARVPPHTEVASSPSWLALICTLVANGTLFTSLRVRHLLSLAGRRRTGRRCRRPSRAGCWPSASSPVAGRCGGGARLAAGSVVASGEPSGWIGARRARRWSAADRRGSSQLIVGVTPHPREHALGATARGAAGLCRLSRRLPGCCFSDQQLPARAAPATSRRVGSPTCA